MLRHAFEKFGTVLDGTEIIHDKEGRSKGFGFVNFAEESAFKKAIEQMNGQELDGRTITVTSALPERKHNDSTLKRRNGLNSTGSRTGGFGSFPFRGYRVTIQNIPPNATWPDLKDFLRNAGEVQFADVVGPGLGIGEFATPQERANVIRELNGKEFKGNRVTIRNLNENDPRYQGGSRPLAPSAGANGQFGPAYLPEPLDYGPGPHQVFDVPHFTPGFDPYQFNAPPPPPPAGTPINGGAPMEFSPIGFAPPPSRVPQWTPPPPHGRGTGRGGYPQYVPPYPSPPNAFPRAQVRPAANGWMFPLAPVRPCLPGRGLERPPPPVYPHQGAIPVRKTDYEHQGVDMMTGYRRSPRQSTGNGESVVDVTSVEHVVYQKRPLSSGTGTLDREYAAAYPTGGRYSAPVPDSPQREKQKLDYSRSKDDWGVYPGYQKDSQIDSSLYRGYEGGGGGLEKTESSGGSRPYNHYHQPHGEDPRLDYSDYSQSRSFMDSRRKEYSRSGGYTGYLNSSAYSRSNTDQTGTGSHNYSKAQPAEDYGMDDYGPGGDGYPSSEAYSKDPPDYNYSRTDARTASYGSEYEPHDGGYYDHRTTGYNKDRNNYREGDPRGAGGVKRMRQRVHRTGPYDH
eukprot:g1588.t1